MPASFSSTVKGDVLTGADLEPVDKDTEEQEDEETPCDKVSDMDARDA